MFTSTGPNCSELVDHTSSVSKAMISYAIINPNNTDSCCFYYTVCLGLMDLNKLKTNKGKICMIKKQIYKEGIHVNHTLEMPVVPTTVHNFMQLVLKNPGIQLNVFTAMPDACSVLCTWV